jgi:hypothetical protein
MKRRLSFALLVFLLAFALPVSAYAGGLMDSKVVLGGTFTLSSDEVLRGDLAVFGGVATLEPGSRVTGSVFVLGGNLEADGEIGSELVVIGGNASLGDSAVVKGDVVTLGGNIDRDGATIEGDEIRGENMTIPLDFEFDQLVDVPYRAFRFPLQARVLGYLFQSFVLAALALLIVMIWPGATNKVGAALVRQPWASAGIGLLTAIAAPVLFIVMIVTICLIPFGLLGIVVLLVAGLFGWVAVGQEVGRRIALALDQELQPLVAAGIGTLVLALVVLGFGFIPCIGWTAQALVGAYGLGAVILTRFGTRFYTPGGPVDVEMPAVEAAQERLAEEVEADEVQESAEDESQEG